MPLLGQYEYILDKSHPRANADGAVYVHMIAAEQKLGRRLFPEEVVHHRDLNKLNNDPNNLIVFASNSDHVRFHMNNCNEDMLKLNLNGAYMCEEQKFYCIDCGAEITRDGTRCVECSRKHSRKVERPTSDELFNILTNSQGRFTEIGRRYGVTDNTVRKWCVAYGIPSKSSDYKEKTTKKQKEKAVNCKIRVIQLDVKTGKELNCFESATEAARKLGLAPNCRTHILDVCREKRKTAYGYRWELA